MEDDVKNIVAFVHACESFDRQLNPEYVSCDFDRKEITVRYRIAPWMINVIGTVHGGIYASFLDDVMGMNASYWAGAPGTPTISMNINYLRPAKPGDSLLLQSHLASIGHHMIHVTASCCRETEPNRVLMTASGVYHNPASAGRKE
ncbi:MAG: PaaI family thioesterase [Oscillospiraceae bacterium]|nr:PaaI family thioesterase [Oscillospiraceae bacterium]